MKKIAILAPYVGTVNRGAETFVIELTKKLSNYFDVDVYTLKREATIEKNLCIVDVDMGVLFNIHNKIYLKSKLYRKIINKFYYLIPDVIFQKKFTKMAFREIESREYDLLFPNNGVWGAKYAAKYREKNGVPFVYTGHGGIGIGERYIIETSPNAYICLTHKHFLWASEIKSNKFMQLCIIPNGVCINNFKSLNKIKKEKHTILSVGALTEFKRHELTIKAVSKIPNVNLVILGKGEEEKYLKNLADLYLPNRCLITSVEYERVIQYYSLADLFVLPSREEPFGIVYLEAMASNLPIVSPDDSQRREIINNAGLFCNVENIEEYAETIRSALNIDWKDIPFKRAQKYDWNNIATMYQTLFDKVIKNKGMGI